MKKTITIEEKENGEVFVEYELLKRECKAAKRDYDKALEKKAEYYYSVLPGASDTSKKLIKTECTNDKFLNYTIKIQEIDSEIEVRKNLYGNLSYRLKLKEIELRNSKELLDRIYVYRYLDRYKVNKIARIVEYSREQTYRKIREIDKKINDDTK